MLKLFKGCMDEYCEIIEDKLYLGSQISIKECTENEGIRSYVRVMWDEPHYDEYPDGSNVLHIRIDDSPTDDIYEHFSGVINFIEDEINKGYKVLIHCYAGISRSATITIAYLMYKWRMCFTEAFNYVFEKREIYPNSGFIQQLIMYQSDLNLNL